MLLIEPSPPLYLRIAIGNMYWRIFFCLFFPTHLRTTYLIFLTLYLRDTHIYIYTFAYDNSSTHSSTHNSCSIIF
eukprot:gene911-538_t